MMMVVILVMMLVVSQSLSVDFFRIVPEHRCRTIAKHKLQWECQKKRALTPENNSRILINKTASNQGHPILRKPNSAQFRCQQDLSRQLFDDVRAFSAGHEFWTGAVCTANYTVMLPIGP